MGFQRIQKHEDLRHILFLVNREAFYLDAMKGYSAQWTYQEKCALKMKIFIFNTNISSIFTNIFYSFDVFVHHICYKYQLNSSTSFKTEVNHNNTFWNMRVQEIHKTVTCFQISIKCDQSSRSLQFYRFTFQIFCLPDLKNSLTFILHVSISNF